MPTGEYSRGTIMTLVRALVTLGIVAATVWMWLNGENVSDGQWGVLALVLAAAFGGPAASKAAESIGGRQDKQSINSIETQIADTNQVLDVTGRELLRKIQNLEVVVEQIADKVVDLIGDGQDDLIGDGQDEADNSAGVSAAPAYETVEALRRQQDGAGVTAG